jgi:sugar phosphate isomerase/epimerase
LGFHTIHFSPMFGGRGELERVIDATSEAGFGWLGLDLASVDEYRSRHGHADDLADRLRMADLRCSDVLPILVDEATDRRGVLPIAELAAELGAAWVVASVPSALPWAALCDRLEQAAGVLWARGVRLAIEHIPHSGLASLAEARRVCETIGWERTGLVLDAFHFHLAPTQLHELEELAADQIAVVQYSDARTSTPVDRSDESRNRRLYPGAGCLPLRPWADAVRRLGFEGVVTAEVLSASVRGQTPREVAQRCHDALVADWVRAG